MLGSSGDVVLSCLVAAGLVVLAHGFDAVGARTRGSWSNSLARAVSVLAVLLVVGSVVTATSRTDLLLLFSTAAAMALSTLPIFGVGAREVDPEPVGTPPPTRRPPRNPWDRAFRVRRDRAAELLGLPRPVDPTHAEQPAPAATAPTAAVPPAATSGTSSTPASSSEPAPAPTRTVREGVIVDPSTPRMQPRTPQQTAPARAPQQAGQARTGSTRASSEVNEAEHTLNDVGQMVGDLGRLLGLDRPDERRRR